MATAKKNTELAPVENFALTTAYDGLDPELAAELKDQMDDLDDESGINAEPSRFPLAAALPSRCRATRTAMRTTPRKSRA